MTYIKRFEEITNEDLQLVGGKGLSLGFMKQANVPVPNGFVLTTEAYQQFYKNEISESATQEILQAFDELNTERVAVRSSAVAEDSTGTSWAGQLESYVYITRETLIDHIQKCWASLHSPKAAAYAQHIGIPVEKQSIAVVIQAMVNSEVSGVLFSVNPISKDANEFMIEAVYGLGELLVQGMVTPANFVVDKHTFEIKSKTGGDQDIQRVFQDGAIQDVSIQATAQQSEIVNPEQIKILCQLAVSIEQLYQKPQDIEWAIEGNTIYIVQSRPITTL